MSPHCFCTKIIDMLSNNLLFCRILIQQGSTLRASPECAVVFCSSPKFGKIVIAYPDLWYCWFLNNCRCMGCTCNYSFRYSNFQLATKIFFGGFVTFCASLSSNDGSVGGIVFVNLGWRENLPNDFFFSQLKGR